MEVIALVQRYGLTSFMTTDLVMLCIALSTCRFDGRASGLGRQHAGCIYEVSLASRYTFFTHLISSIFLYKRIQFQFAISTSFP
jgi:hypothetical protein